MCHCWACPFARENTIHPSALAVTGQQPPSWQAAPAMEERWLPFPLPCGTSETASRALQHLSLPGRQKSVWPRAAFWHVPAPQLAGLYPAYHLCLLQTEQQSLQLGAILSRAACVTVAAQAGPEGSSAGFRRVSAPVMAVREHSATLCFFASAGRKWRRLQYPPSVWTAPPME